MNKNHYKVVFVLGADVDKDKNDKYILAEEDSGGPLLSEWRLLAVKKLYEEKMVDEFVIVSYFQCFDNEKVWRCEVMKNILIENYQIPEKIIKIRKQSEKASVGNGIEIKRFLSDYSIKKEDCAFLTNFYHIPRTTALFQKIDLFLRPIAAESFFVDKEMDIRKDYGQTKLTFYDRLIKELTGMQAEELENKN